MSHTRGGGWSLRGRRWQQSDNPRVTGSGVWVGGREEETAVGGGEGVAVVVPARWRRGGEGMNCLGPHNQAYTDELPLQEHWSVDHTNILLIITPRASTHST